MEASEGKTTGAPGVSSSPAPQRPPAEEPERYDVAGWRERIMRFQGVSVHAIAGALHDVEDDALLSENEVKQRLDAFHERKVAE